MVSRSIICRSRTLRRDTDKSQYFVITEFNNCFIIGHRVCFLMNIWHFAIFKQERLQEGEKCGFIYAWAAYFLQPNTDGRHCTWADHYLQAVIFSRSRGGLSANEREEKFALNDNCSYSWVACTRLDLFLFHKRSHRPSKTLDGIIQNGLWAPNQKQLKLWNSSWIY